MLVTRKPFKANVVKGKREISDAQVCKVRFGSCDLVFDNLWQIELEAFLPVFIEREWWLQEKLAKQKQRPKGRGEGLLFRVDTMAL